MLFMDEIKEWIRQIKASAYRYPSAYINLTVFEEYHKLLVLSWLVAYLDAAVDLPNFFLFIITPCVMLCVTAVRCDTYRALFYRAENDYLIRHTLAQRQDINTQDYLLWVSFEAYKKYRERHRDESSTGKIIIWSTILISFFLFISKLF